MSPVWDPPWRSPRRRAVTGRSASPSRARPGGATSPGARSDVPELPEVETIVREIAPRLEGCRIARVELKKTDVLRQVSKPRLIQTLSGNTIEQVTRRAKHAVFRLSSGHRMIIQPRMTGSLVAHERPLTKEQTKYAVLICTLNEGRRFVYRDVRRLGTIWLLDEKGWKAYTERIGPEPLDETFTPFVFAERLRTTRTAVKKAIMDQRRIAGVGNIYANEALFEAGIDPSKPTHKLSLSEFAALHEATVGILGRAVEAAGTTVRDYRTGTGGRGRFQFELRATTFCPRCQR